MTTMKTPARAGRIRRKSAALILAALSLSGTLVAASDASAATARPAASWLGKCYPYHKAGTKWAGGWCDGNGPHWQYWAFVNCSGSHRYFGPYHWAGDRRGSYVSCPAGRSYKSGGVYSGWVN
ncbi:hypothetical protein ACFV2U_40105 [Streptomyces sp. NPDC059697]|uniref:hypothetical protein n=1 Tax=Streptomyces sp. NPDC059697 TaxID=3346912 RepID=UPI0036CD1E13